MVIKFRVPCASEGVNSSATMAANLVWSEVFTYESLVHAISGMTGGVAAITVFFPLNTIRLRLQIDQNMKSAGMITVAREIARDGGPLKLYQGLWGNVVCLATSNFVYFYTYNALKMVYRSRKRMKKDADIGTVANLAIATASGALNVVVTAPLWTASARLSTQRSDSRKEDGTVARRNSISRAYTGIFDCVLRVAEEEGVPALWNGTASSLVLVSNPSIQFVVYERLRAPLFAAAARRGRQTSAVEIFVIGAIAKTVATLLTYPLQIAQSRLRVQKTTGPLQAAQYRNTADCLAKIAASDGLLGWFKGMEAKLVQTVLTAAFQFLTYEQVQSLVFAALLRRQQKA